MKLKKVFDTSFVVLIIVVLLSCSIENTHIHEWKLINAEDTSTCISFGKIILKYLCSCGEEKIIEEYSSPKEHDFQLISQENATCIDSGSTKYSCSRCGYEYSVTTNPKGHVYVATRTEGNCLSVGSTIYCCGVCGHEYVEEGDSLGSHAFDEIITESPSCTEVGYNHAKCIYCNEDIIISEIPPTGHNFTGTILQDTTCLEEGSEKLFCSNCYLTEIRTIPALGHCYTISTSSFDSTIVPICKRCKTTYGNAIDLSKYNIEPVGSFYVSWNEEENITETWFSKITYSDTAHFSYYDGREEDELINIVPASTSSYTGEYLKITSSKLVSYYESTATSCICTIAVNDENNVIWSGYLKGNDGTSLRSDQLPNSNGSVWGILNKEKYSKAFVNISFGNELVITSSCDMQSLWEMLDDVSEYIYEINSKQ